MQKVFRVRRYGCIEVSCAADQISGPWVSLAGDCFFRNLYADFSIGPLRAEDCPLTISFPRSRIDELLDAVENFLPPTTGLLIVHVGANNIASNRFPARVAASILLDRCVRLLRSRPHIGEISICLLSPRTVDDHGVYSEDYIAYYNEKVASFNDEIVRCSRDMPGFSFIDFKLEQMNLWYLLRGTGFGVNDDGRQSMAQTLQAIIIWKRLVGETIRRGEPSMSEVPDRLFNLPPGTNRRLAPRTPHAAVSQPRRFIESPVPVVQPVDARGPRLSKPPRWPLARESLLLAPSNYSDSCMQGQFRDYMQGFTWSENSPPLVNHLPAPQSLCVLQTSSPPEPVFGASGHSRPEHWHRTPLLNRATNLPARYQPPIEFSRLTRCVAARVPSRTHIGKRALRSIGKARRKKARKNGGKSVESRM